MQPGIYLLRFTGTNKVYVGQSENILYRYKKHIQRMKAGTTTRKLQEAYDMFGIPTLEIILECDTEDLNKYEQEALDIFDAVKSGFNTAGTPDIHLKGEDNGAAKYSNEQVVRVLEALLDLSNSYADIETITGVKNNTVRHIANGESHTWLKSQYPEKYAQMLEVKKKRIYARTSAGYKNKQYPPIKAPDGTIYTNITNLTDFAKEHNLDPSGLSKVLNRRPKYNSHKGWRLVD